jgi:hypothetical protein
MVSPAGPPTDAAGAALSAAGRAPGTRPLPAQTRVLLRWIGEGGLASRAQLARRFWPAARYPRTAYQHLYRLVRQGYLLTTPYDRHGRHHDLYVLTAAGSAVLGTVPPFVRIGWPPSHEWPHLLGGQEVRLHLEQRLAAAGQGGAIRAWRTDYRLRHLPLPARAPAAIADIQMEWCRTATSASETVLIEIDGAYFGQMLATKVAAYADPATRVLWVCSPHRVARRRRAVAAQYQNEIQPQDVPL